jgi:DNA-binding beta-propeller fold protein YncE
MILSNLLKIQSSYRWKILLPAALTAGVALLAGCNDTLRQFIVPVPKPGGDQTGTAHAVILSTNPVGQGSDMHIDVSGDTISGIVNVGNNPVFLGKTSGRAWVIDGDNTITTYIALLPLTSTFNTVVLPATDSGAVAGGTSSVGNFYTANSGSNNTDQVSSGVLAVTQTVPLPAGSVPVAVAGNSANSKIYFVNHGTNNVTVLSTTDNTVNPKPIPVGVNPIWAVMSADGVDVFVVNQGDGTLTNPGSVSVIDTTLDIVIATINVGNFPATSQPNFAYFDTNRQRLYVTNTGENTVSVIKADGINLGVTPQVLPVLLKNITVGVASGFTPISVAALNDGSRVYAALGNCPAGTNHTNLVLPTPTTGRLASCNGNLVSVIDATALAETSTLNVGSGAVSVDVDANATHVYAVAAHAAQVAIIRPSTNSITTTFPAPQQNLSCAVPTNCPANATQTPFMVRVFP